MNAVCTTALLLAAIGAAADDGATPVAIEAGRELNLCKASLTVCPISTSICDDPRVAVIQGSAEGAVLKGVGPGTTLCSVLGYESAFRRLLRVTVKAAAGGPGGPGAPDAGGR